MDNKIESVWHKGSMVSSQERGLSFYEKKLGVSREELRGKTILDLGAGKELQLAQDINKEEIGAKLFSMSPHFADKYYRNKMKDIPEAQKSLAGVAQAMPFADNTFDYLLGILSVPYYLHHLADEGDEKIPYVLNLFFSEALRVLRIGGQLRFTPYSDMDIEVLKTYESSGSITIQENPKANLLVVTKVS